MALRRSPASVVVPKSAIVWSASGADFGTMDHTRKQWFASVLIESKVRKRLLHGMTNFRFGTLAVTSAIALAVMAGRARRPGHLRTDDRESIAATRPAESEAGRPNYSPPRAYPDALRSSSQAAAMGKVSANIGGGTKQSFVLGLPHETTSLNWYGVYRCLSLPQAVNQNSVN
jgi:hypothetical protein